MAVAPHKGVKVFSGVWIVNKDAMVGRCVSTVRHYLFIWLLATVGRRRRRRDKRIHECERQRQTIRSYSMKKGYRMRRGMYYANMQL